jgi:protein-tyrosine phosphatase
MIDLHSHILPGLCDGSQNLETSLQMARIAVEDGITHLACTPHIYPNVFANNTAIIRPALNALQAELDRQGIPLRLVIGADVHMVPEVINGLKSGEIPTLHGSRYFLLEPSHHVPVIGFVQQIENFINAGYVPVITHPERLHWIQDHYDTFLEAAQQGAWIQLTAGAISGKFGKPAKHWAERFLKEGYVHIIASDAHGVNARPPLLSEGVDAASHMVGDRAEVMRMVLERPQAILDNTSPEEVEPPPALQKRLGVYHSPQPRSWFQRLWG